MNGWTRFFLVLLRLAIGWHFLFEGIEKIHSVNVGPTQTNRPWSSKGYLREANGPLASYFRRQTGDSDEQALELLSVKPVPSGQDPARMPAHERMAPLLDQAWKEYLERFEIHYKIEDPKQREQARAKLTQAEDQAVLWLLGQKGDPKEEEKVFGPLAVVKVKRTAPERIQEYRAKVEEIRDIENRKLPAFERDVEKGKLRALKAEAGQLRTELLADLQKPMIESLQSVLSPEQERLGPVPTTDAELGRSWYHKSRMEWIDWLTMYGLTAVGVGLLLGLFTRLSCLGGAAFLLMFYLTQPPFPWVPENIRAEGHYLFVNKNLIEMLALLALATTCSGRWVGLDGLLHYLNPWRKRSEPAPTVAGDRLAASHR